jgi:hypothetical protein
VVGADDADAGDAAWTGALGAHATLPRITTTPSVGRSLVSLIE